MSLNSRASTKIEVDEEARIGTPSDNVSAKEPIDDEEKAKNAIVTRDSVRAVDEKLARDPAFLVSWDGPDDPENPHSWSTTKRWYLTFFGGLLTLNCSFASSAPSGVILDLERDFGFSNIVGSLLISLFIAGYCVGPLLWGPLSEAYGRRPIFIISFFAYTVFQMACALSHNTGSILVFRFLGGCFAASPLTNAGALMADLWPPKVRGKAMALFTVAPFAGPALGPIVSGFIGVSGASWRWLFWVLTIFAGLCFVMIIFTLPETFAPIILKKKAHRKRKETGDNRWYAPIEAVHVPLGERIVGIMVKPWKVLFEEPMLMAITVYISFTYGCLYLLFEAYPIVFGRDHGLSGGLQGLTFLPLFLGGMTGCAAAVFYYNPKYSKLVDEYAPLPVPPEERLPMAIGGAVVFTITFFWFGWTSFPSVSIWASMSSGIPMGFALTLIFLSLINYIVDVYLQVAASALAANTVVRSSFGAGFPLFATQMFEKLNPRWASTLLGCIALILMPIPILFIRYGPYLRSKSKNAPGAKR